MYDYLIIGSGLYGLTWNYLATQAGKKCLIIEKRPTPGGNIVTEDINGIPVHKYGPHIFHTNDEKIWTFIKDKCEISNFINSPMAYYKGELYNLPFNMNTFYKVFKTASPEVVKSFITSEIKAANISTSRNLEEQAISMVGTTIYKKLVKEYTEKQWGRDCKDLPPDIIKRLPLRFTFNNNYFNSVYQGVPDYNKLIDVLKCDSDIILSTDYFLDKNSWDSKAKKIIYTGALDEFFNYKFGKLDWRTVYWKNEILDWPNFQGVAVMNFTSHEMPYTRIIEHKHFYPDKNFDTTVLSYEYSEEYSEGKEKFYPINDQKNIELSLKYKQLAELQKDKIIFGGRLAEYKYYDMDSIIKKCMEDFENESNSSHGILR